MAMQEIAADEGAGDFVAVARRAVNEHKAVANAAESVRRGAQELVRDCAAALQSNRRIFNQSVK
eukprot:6357979-Alexandrium_andersonii.AAC.1